MGGRSTVFAAFLTLCLNSRGWGFTQKASLRRRVPVRLMGWGDDITFGETTIISNKPACGGGIRSIVVEASNDDIFTPYSTPGQFVQMKEDLEPETKPGFYAIASPPSTSRSQEFLIKKADSNSWLCDAAAGLVVPTSPAMGRGFNIAGEIDEDVETVLLFAAGTGIAPIRSAIESGKLEGKSVKLYYGARRAATAAYDRLFDGWKNDFGVDVQPIYSQGTLKQRQGYVQAALREDGVENPSKTAALLCGMKGMSEDVTNYLKEVGVDEKKILMNF